jgi:putative membrane protein
MVAWTLVFHIIGLVFWLGSLMVVTHVLALHTEEPFPEARETLRRLESKLLKGLAHPGAALMVITGIILVTRNPEYLRERWLQAKLFLVFILIALDLIVYFRTLAFHAGTTKLRRRECVALHGAIALVFFAILILVLTKPFGLRVRRSFAGAPSPATSVAVLSAASSAWPAPKARIIQGRWWGGATATRERDDYHPDPFWHDQGEAPGAAGARY